MKCYVGYIKRRDDFLPARVTPLINNVSTSSSQQQNEFNGRTRRATIPVPVLP